jgi:hypothetical protein
MVSMKVVAATIGAALAPAVVAFVAEQLDTKLDVNVVQAVIASGIAALGAAVAGYMKRA